uniref:Ig-like domain-containing protein n=1 Tax=Neolamprologus brichardi TaxID=32507 RepID=A0A3Q4GZ79_NEOBR
TIIRPRQTTGAESFSAEGSGCDQKNITAESGQNVTLTCRAPSTINDLAEWSRADLGDEYVLLYRDGHIVQDNQHHSFKNRVDLQETLMKDGDVSLILNNVTTADTGTYECRVRLDETWKLLSSIYLSVVDPPGERASSTITGLHHCHLLAEINIAPLKVAANELFPLLNSYTSVTSLLCVVFSFRAQKHHS